MDKPITRTCPRIGEAYEEIIHPSGLTVLVSHKVFSTHHAILGVRYGAADRPVGMRLPLGVAHFLEHKMFAREEGSFDDDFGALGADANAYTTYDRTAYLFSATEHFSEALRLLLTMTQEVTVHSASVARERDIIAEEIRMNADEPWERCYAELLRAMYRKHPVREEICGSESSIRRISPRILEDSHRAFYRPDNMVLAVSGRATMTEVLDAVDAVLGTEPPTTPLPARREIQEPSPVATSYTVRRMDTSKPLFAIGAKHPHPPRGAEALLRCDIAMSILSEMLFSHSGDFYNDLFESGTISPGMSYSTSLGEGYGCLTICGEADSPDEVMTAFRAYIARVRQDGLSEEDFVRVRRILYADYVSGFDATEDIASSLFDYALDSLGAPTPVGVFDYLRVIESLTLSDIEALFREVFRATQYALSVVLPLA